MKYAPWVLAVLALLGALWLSDRAEHNAAVWEGRAQVADSLRLAAESKARADSLGLERAKASFLADSTRLASERFRSRLEATRAAQRGQEAANVLRESLDVQQAVLLDSIQSAHAQEIAAKDEQIAQADSSTAVERSLRLATEQALQSERQAHQSATSEIGTLQAQVQALQRSQKRKGMELWLTRAAVVTVLVIR